jgi:hypothetical protein
MFVRLSSRLEELHRISVRIFHLDLPAAGSTLHLIAKLYSRLVQYVDLRRKVGYAKDDSVPSARRLGLTAGHRTRSRRARPAEQQREFSERHTRKCGELLMFQREAEMVLVEGSSPGDIGYLIAHAMDAENTAQSVRVTG